MDFEIGTLDCKSLDLAENAKKLQFQLTPSEVCAGRCRQHAIGISGS